MRIKFVTIFVDSLCEEMMQKVKLKKDIVIPKGTILQTAPVKTERNDEHFDCVIGLSDNTTGTFTYCIDTDFIDELFEYFEDTEN